MSQYRDWVENQQAALLQELQADEDRQQAAAVQAAQPEPQPAKPQPDPAVEQERQRIAAERQRLATTAYWAQASQAEHAAAQEMQEIRSWLPAEYSQDELRNPSLIQDAERRGWLSTAVDRHNALQQHLQNAGTIRAAHQQQAAYAHQAQVDKWASAQDDLFNRQLAERHPQLAADTARMQRAAKDYLKRTTGLTESQITREWRNGRWRSAAEQMILADAVSHEMARASVRDLGLKRQQVPPVQRPGVDRPRGAVNEDQMRDVERQLESAKGDRALRLATKLHQMRRAAQGDY
jgi:hypothetical protein